MGRTFAARIAVVAFILCWGIGLGNPASAQTGKIAGTINDAETSQSIPGANVLIEGTQRGTAADAQGDYFIIGVQPGTYSLRVSMIGYTPVIIEDVRVQSGLTTRVDVTLSPGTYEVEDAVVVTAERPVIQRDETSSVQYLQPQQLLTVPVQTAERALQFQAGVYFDPVPIAGGLGGGGRGESRYAIRGGNQTEVKWYIDGVRAAALVQGRADQGGSFTNISKYAVEEIRLLTGGFNAEYGGAQSGIVNVVTKDGSMDFGGALAFLYEPPNQRHFGNYLYDRETQKEFQDNMLEDGTLDPGWWTPLRRSQVYDYRDLADRHLFASFGGPIFSTDGAEGTFFISSQFRRQPYVVPHPRDYRTLDQVLVNTAFAFQPGMRLELSGLYSHTGHSTLQENGQFTNQAKYYRGWGSILEDRTTLFSARWTHFLSQDFYYNVRLSRYLRDMREKPSEYVRLGKSENPTLFGFQRYNGFPDEPFDAWSFIYDQHHQAGDISLEVSANWQVDDNNLVEGGIEARYNTISEIKAYRFPSFTMEKQYWINRGLHETYHPLQFAAYLQDKMEFKGMILNLGVRYDYFNPNREWFVARNFFNLAIDPDYDPSQDPDNDQVDAQGDVKYSFQNVLDKPREPAPAHHMISPRIGVSFPISSQTKLHFNYGHFYQMPPLDRVFDFGYFRPEYIVERMMEEAEQAEAEGRSPRHIPSLDGNPERVVSLTAEPLEPEKTIAFEVGIEHNFSDIFVLDVTGYYKDVFNQSYPRIGLFDRQVLGFDPFRGAVNPNVFYVTNLSGDYGDARGFEVALRTLFSENVWLNANYSFALASQGRATPGRIEFDETGQPTFIYNVDVSRRLPTVKALSRPHILRANLFARYPQDPKGGFLDAVLGGVSASILFRYVSGRTFTFLGPDDPPTTRDNHRYPPLHQIDLRLEKTFSIAEGHDISVFTNIVNALNTKNLRLFGDVIFDPEAVQKYIEDGTITRVDGGGYDISWMTYYPPRQVFFGIRYMWN